MDQAHSSVCATRDVAGTWRVGASLPFLLVCAMLMAGGAQPAMSQSTANAVVPPQAPARDGLAAIADTHLWYWDTGGEGPPVVLLHPASGSGLIWGYQQAALVKAGYRVIAYSRRSYFNSDALAKDRPGIGSADLHGLIELLGLTKFHLLGSAAGGTVAVDYALSHPDRL
jgi:pimeloyl-ACP methyl ester carboxylesterase